MSIKSFLKFKGYGVGSKAPGIKESGTKDYIAAHNQLRSHARAYRLYERKYKQSQQGKFDLKPCQFLYIY